MKLLDKIKINLKHKKEEDSMLSTIEEIIDEREERGDSHLIDAREIPMVKNIFMLRDIRVHDVMTPRVDIDAIPLDMPPDDFCKFISEEKFTRYPVYDKILDNIVGVVHVKDVLMCLVKNKKCHVADVMKEKILFVSPAMRTLDLLKEMQSKQIQMAIVVDEHGGVDGLISLEDLLEVIVGEIEDEHDNKEEKEIQWLNEETADVDAKLRLDEFEKEVLPLATQEERENPDIDTIGGLISHMTGRVPMKGEVIHHPSSKLRFVILSSDSRGIKKMRVMNIRKEEKEE